LTETETLKGNDFDELQRRVDAKHPKLEINQIEAELNRIEEELTIIRLSQLSIEYKLQRIRILAKNK